MKTDSLMHLIAPNKVLLQKQQMHCTQKMNTHTPKKKRHRAVYLEKQSLSPEIFKNVSTTPTSDEPCQG